MRPHTSTEAQERRLAEVARAQWGVFSRAQAIKAGLGAAAISRRTGSGSWVRVFPGVYRGASTPESWNGRLLAACLWAGDGAVVSHRTAARLHGLEGLPTGKRGDPVELTVPLAKTGRAPGVLLHRSRKLERLDKSAINGIPVTSLGRTLVDIAPMLDEKHLSMALDSGLARHTSIDVRMLRRVLGRLKAKGRAGTALLEKVLDARSEDAVHLDSALERRFLAALKSAKLPRPSEHHDVVDGGRHVAELDFAYPRRRIGIQLNGGNIHRQKARWERDQEQSSDLAALGWCVLNVTWSQLEKSEAAVLERVARALEQRAS
jgi:hypothetical protein